MLRDWTVAVLLALALPAAPGWAGPSVPKPGFFDDATTRSQGPAQPLFCPMTAACFREIAREAAQSLDLAGPQADQAIVLLTAAASLSTGIAPVEPLLLELAGRHPENDYSDQTILWLQDYVDESCDRVVVRDAVQSLLDRQNLWEDRKRLLEELGSRLAGKNAAVDSDLAMMLGFLIGEKADFATAKLYLMQAYRANKYNKVAFAKLAEIASDEIGVGTYLEHLRLVLRENPLDLNAGLNFAQYAERLQLYDAAALSYQYCAELHRYLHPGEPLPPHIYLPWAISSYNTERGQHVALQIADSVRSSGRFDMLLDAIAGRAAAKAGHLPESRRIFQQAEEQARRLLDSGAQSVGQDGMIPVRPLSPRQLAWFYCFADLDAAKALDYANKAYSTEPNTPSVSALLAYALSLNDQMEWAKPILQSCAGNQIADLVQAKIQMTADQRRDAVQTLYTAINKDPGSLAAERAREMLAELQSEYVPPIRADALMTFLTGSVGKAAIPDFLPPDKMVQVRFNIHGNEVTYGSDIDGTVAIVNQGHEPLIITEDSLLKGNIRIDARVGGSLQRQISPLVSQTVRTTLAVEPGRSYVIPVRLSTGELRDILRTHPQAALEIQFTLYLDPVVTDDGSVSNRLADLAPVTAGVKRPAVELTASYVRNRFNAISSGQQGQKIATAQLFTGLLCEQRAMAERGTLYAYRYADWMPGLLRSALTNDSGLLLGNGQDDWVVAVRTMADMLSVPLDEQLTAAVARNLDHPKWPVRLMALYLLANQTDGNFEKVLDWFAQSDPNELVRDMATTLKSSAAVAAARPAHASHVAAPDQGNAW